MGVEEMITFLEILSLLVRSSEKHRESVDAI
jgi:hypothetical protein